MPGEVKPNPIGDLADLFSDYRAEWSASVFGDLFIAPPYFSKLEYKRPCLLIGGRGTGKTTSLRSLRFDASSARLQADGLSIDELAYYGLYVRINKNRVRAFQGAQLPDEDWHKSFAHYFNVLVIAEVCRLLQWLARQGVAHLPQLDAVSASLGLPGVSGHDDLLKELNKQLITLELFVNNPQQSPRPIFSAAEAPLKYVADAFRTTESVKDKLIFSCIDEYENLLDYQQAIINGYIKHTELPLSYKVGIKRNGLRTRATVDSQDVLATPDDYTEIDIGQESFDLFAKEVIEHRLHRARERGILAVETLDELLPELPLAVEAEKLGCDRVADEVLDAVLAADDKALIGWARQQPKNELYFVKYWAEGGKGSIVDLAKDWQQNPDAWLTRFGNYGYASLFWLSKGRKGARIRKYYAGARTFLGLASGNIRYFIELIDESLHLAASEMAVSQWSGSILPEHQTLAARTVGKRRLDQLEGLSEKGPEIKRLVLALGKVFFEFARDPVGRSPERNAFVVAGASEARSKVLELLKEGVSILAFEATPRTKATSQREMRDDEFRIHPIYAPFFEYSHRRKRRLQFEAETLLDILKNPARALDRLLSGHGVTTSDDLPNQLAMFSSFFDSAGKEP
jgi:hypothetical protein